MPHFENMGRRVPLISRTAEREAGRRDKLSWKHLELMRRLWKGRLVVKGILDSGDARIARESGVDGIIVSNHGGRQLDGAVAPLRVLPGIAAEAGGMTVMMDSGVRRGTDVLKALALGAQFVFIGRPFLFAAAVAGEPGVRHAIKLLKDEIDRDMALLGIETLAQMRRELLTCARGPQFLRLENGFGDDTQRIDAGAAQQHGADLAVLGALLPNLQPILDAFGRANQRRLVYEAVRNGGDRLVAAPVQVGILDLRGRRLVSHALDVVVVEILAARAHAADVKRHLRLDGVAAGLQVLAHRDRHERSDVEVGKRLLLSRCQPALRARAR